MAFAFFKVTQQFHKEYSLKFKDYQAKQTMLVARLQAPAAGSSALGLGSRALGFIDFTAP